MYLLGLGNEIIQRKTCEEQSLIVMVEDENSPAD